MHNHRKLRHYDLSQAKVGDVVLTGNLLERATVIAVSKLDVALHWHDDHISVFRRDDGNTLKQPPLVWLGEDPIYAGDTLWIVDEKHVRYGKSQVAVKLLGDTLVLSIENGWTTHAVVSGQDINDLGLWSITEPKLRLIEINGHKVPEPLREAPPTGTKYFISDIAQESLLDGPYTWAGDAADMRWLKRGLLHSTKEAALAHSKALLSFTEVES